MQGKSLVLLFLSGLYMLLGCRKLVQNEFPDFEQKTTLNTLFAADSILQLHLSTTNKMNHDSLKVIENAEVNLFADGVFLQVLEYTDRGIYQSTIKIQPLKNYHCEVEFPDGEKTSSNCIVPESTPLESVSLNPRAWINNDGLLSPSVTFTLKNDTAVDAFYEARIIIFSGWGADFDFSESFSLELFSNRNESDSLIDNTIQFQPNSGGSNKQFAYMLELRTVSNHYYQYAESLILYEKGRYPEFSTGTVVPYNLYSNVENGYGIFAAYATTFSDTLFTY